MHKLSKHLRKAGYATMHGKYVVATYLRLSVDDGLSGDSHSISAQRDLLSEFIGSRDEFCDAKILEFCDDGYTGSNFDRPGVSALLGKARCGEIDCIAVKDFSRFGRSYIEVGDYIEQIFPFLQVRFISVGDCYDSQVQGSSAGDVGIAFKHLCNDYYSKEYSRKVRDGLKTKWDAGKVTYAFAIYGYMIDPNDRHKYVINPETAPVVRRIFDMALSSVSFSLIAKTLNAEGIPTPSQHRKNAEDYVRGVNKSIWTRNTISRMLQEIRYTGATAHGMYESKLLGGPGRKKPRSEWIVHEGMHEAIVSKEEAERVQQIIKRKAPSVESPRAHKRALPIIVRCGGCGHAMVRKPNNNYRCSNAYLAASDSCYPSTISLDIIKGVLLSSIEKLHVKAAPVTGEVAPDANNMELRNLQAAKEKMDSQCASLYLKYNDGIISREEYLRERKQLDDCMREASIRISALENAVGDVGLMDRPLPTILQDCSTSMEYTAEIVKALVDCVVVHGDGSVEIKWRS